MSAPKRRLLPCSLALLALAACAVQPPPEIRETAAEALPETTEIPELDSVGAAAAATGAVRDGWLETFGDPGGDTVVGVFTPDGTQLIGCDDDNPMVFNYYSLFSCCLPPGTYCVGVKGYNANPIENYNIDFNAAGSCTADPDPLNANCNVENTFGACVPF